MLRTSESLITEMNRGFTTDLNLQTLLLTQSLIIIDWFESMWIISLLFSVKSVQECHTLYRMIVMVRNSRCSTPLATLQT